MQTILAVDIDPILSSSFELNFPGSKLHRGDVSKLTRQVLTRLMPQGVDAVIGGAPCQAFSEIGANDPADPRRKLVQQFFRVVRDLDPSIFVFENVRGLMFEKNIGELNAGLKILPSYWKTLGPVMVDASDFGAPTRRKRMIVFGFNTNKVSVPNLEDLVAPLGEKVNVHDAIVDLQDAVPTLPSETGYSRWTYSNASTLSSYARRMRDPSGLFTGHTKTRHEESTIARFAQLSPGKVDIVGRYPRLEWTGLCPTLRAGTGSDKGSYQAVRPIHPTEHRVITPREAARLQGFPDSFWFHPTVWHSCRMIGNSVSPIMAEVLLRRVVEGAGLSRPLTVAAE